MLRKGMLMRLIAQWIVGTLSIYVVAWLLPGIQLGDFTTAIWAGLVLGVLNVMLKPILIILTLPATIFSMGLFIWFINAFILYLVGALVENVTIDSFWSALWGALLISILSSIMNMILSPDDRKIRIEFKRHE